MKRLIPFILFIIILLSSHPAVAAGNLTYTWSGPLQVGDKIVANGVILAVDVDKTTNKTAIIVQNATKTLGVYYLSSSTVSFNVSTLQVQAVAWKGEVIITITSPRLLEVTRPGGGLVDLKAQIQKLQLELSNKTKTLQALKAQIAALKKENDKLQQNESKKAPGGGASSAEITKLKEENIKLKETIANQTQKIMELRATIENLKEQNQYLANITKDAYVYANKVGLQESYQKEKKRAHIIDLAWGFGKLATFLLGLLLVFMGYLYYNWRRV